MKRPPMKPRKGKVWKSLSPISKNKIKAAARFIPTEVMEHIRARSHGMCEFEIRINHSTVRVCNRQPQDPHHILPRSRGGKHTAENLLYVCRQHHQWIHNNPKEAKENNMLQ